MKITRIALSHHRLPLEPPFPAAWDARPRSHFDATIVRVETDEGLVGIGSGDAMPGFAGHEDLFLGHDPRHLERHFRVIEALSFHYGRCWPLDLALWDLAGKIAGEPCWRMLGGSSDRLDVYASTGARRPAGETAELARELVDEGFAAMKVRLEPRDWQEGVAAVAAVRGAVGDALELMVDCNQGWRMPWDAGPPWTFAEALEVAKRLEELDVRWLEEPLHRADYDGLERLKQATRLGIAGGEMARELHDLRELVERGCVDVLQPDAALAGGLTGLAPIARMAHARGVLFTPHTWGNGIGLLANAQLAAGLDIRTYLEFPHDPPHWTHERRDFPLAEPITVDREGRLTLPPGAGLGLSLDEKRLAATRV